MSVLVPVAALVALLVACGRADSPGVTASAARTPGVTPSASPLPSASPSAAAAALVRCETFPQQTYVNSEYGFSASCPSGFWWETFGNPAPDWLFTSRTVEDKYKNGYPAGQIEFGVRTFDSDTLRDWLGSHTGDPMAADGYHILNSVSNVRDISVGESPAIAFDYVMQGPESPNDFHAVALVLKSRYTLLIDWWAYANSGYATAISNVAKSVVASITVV